MTGKELVKKLQQAGWEIDRIKGSHYVLKNGAKREVIPVHSNKDLPKGLAEAIRKRTGI